MEKDKKCLFDEIIMRLTMGLLNAPTIGLWIMILLPQFKDISISSNSLLWIVIFTFSLLILIKFRVIHIVLLLLTIGTSIYFHQIPLISLLNNL